MYVLGGDEVTDEVDIEDVTASVLRLNGSAQVWNEAAPVPEALNNCGACVLASSIFIFGGCCSGDAESLTATTYCYNTATDVWSTLPHMPEAIMNHRVCEVSGLIYVIGGEGNSGIVVSSVHRFDPATNAWRTVAPMLSPRVGFMTFVRGGNIFAAGGSDGSRLHSSVERYDVASDSWEVVSDMALSSARAYVGAQVMTLEVSLFDSLETKARCARS
jgi:kelch-like protein 17 (actinfilin)/kelch-like protein 20